MRKLILCALAAALLLCLVSCGEHPSLIYMTDGVVFHEDVLDTEDEIFERIGKEPTKEGFFFGGWYYDEGEWEKPLKYTELNNQSPTGKTYVYAKWEHVALRYEEDTRTYTVIGVLAGATENVVIPEKCGDLPVTAIAAEAFRNHKTLKSIVMPDTVTAIGEYAFAGCGALESITLPHSVETVERGAFSGCSALTAATLSVKMTEIPAELFSGCARLESVAIPKAVKRVGHRAFSGCAALTEMTLPVALRSMGSEVFRGTGFTQLTFEGTMESWARLEKTDFAAYSAITAVRCLDGEVTP